MCYGKISTRGIQDNSTGTQVINEAMRVYSTAGTTVYVGINYITPAHTLDIVNVNNSVNALNIKHAAGS